MSETTKRCSACGKTRPKADFWRCAARRDGLQNACKACQGEMNQTRNRTDYNRRLYTELRRAALAAYGNACACCAESTYEFLAIDHIDGGGNAHRREVGGGASFLRWLRDNGYPSGFRILCHNCNMARGFFGRCPHETPQPVELVKQA